MRKEVSFAVIIGIILGGAILFGINLANQSTANLPKTNTPSIITPSPVSEEDTASDTKKQEFEITIPSFADNDVVLSTPLTLAGTANPNSPIAVVTENDDLILTTDNQGIFSANINLNLGQNLITISQPQKDGTLVSKQLHLYYTNKPIQ